MGHCRLVQNYSFLSIIIFILHFYSVNSAAFKNGKQLANLPNLSFQVPVLGLFGNSGGNIFARSTVTRTVISTVTTVTVPSYRTCTTTAMMFSPCAGRKRRDTDGENELEGNDLNDLIHASPSIKVIIGKTEITDPAAVAQILNLEKNEDGFYKKKENEEVIMDTDAAATTGHPLALQDGQEQGQGRDDVSVTTSNYPVYLDPSEETTTAAEVTSQEVFSDDHDRDHDHDTLISSPGGRDNLSSNNDNVVEVTTGETPYSDDIISKLEDGAATTTDSTAETDDDRARLAVGQGGKGGSTVTTTIPVTQVVSTAVTIMSSTLTVMYAGCSPGGPLPVVGQVCAM